MLMRALLPTANSEMNGMRAEIGKSGAAVCTTVTSGVHIQRRSGGLRVLAHQLEIGACGEQGDAEGHEEGQPRRSPTSAATWPVSA